MRVICYARISSSSQSLESQIDAIREYAKMRNFEIVKFYTDIASGRTDDRKNFQQMMQDIDAGVLQFDALLVYKLDRVGRNVLNLLNFVEYLKNHNKHLISFADNIDTSTNIGRMLTGIFAILAEYERNAIAERCMLGRQYAEKNLGVKFGRKPADIDIEYVKYQIGIGIPKAQIAKQQGVSRVTLYKYLNMEEQRGKR